MSAIVLAVRRLSPMSGWAFHARRWRKSKYRRGEAARARLHSKFYVSYAPIPLSHSKQKSTCLETVVDPVSFGLIGVIAGIQQSQRFQ